mgnify:CR=1 FL=1
MCWLEQVDILLDVAIAMGLGGLIGLERETADKPAGLRTHMLVAATSALLVGLGNALVNEFRLTDGSSVDADPMRLVQAIVMGIGFLGAGTIIQRGRSERIEGLTTGASLLFAAALGVCVAVDLFLLAVGSTALGLLVLLVLGRLEKWLEKRRQ